MTQGSVAIKVRKILVENGVDRDLADALSLAFDEMYHSQMSEVATKEDVKALREDMKMFMQMLDKRFEELLHYVDKRFEDMNKRFTFLQWLIVVLFTVYTGIITFITTYVLPQLLR